MAILSKYSGVLAQFSRCGAWEGLSKNNRVNYAPWHRGVYMK